MLGRTLYHYTTARGFAGIVQSRSLWATNFSFLNDRSEMLYGLELVRHELASPAFSVDTFGRAFLDAVHDQLRVDVLPEVYVCCFTGLSDNLSQWRAYGTANAARYSIGFDAAQLRDGVSRQIDTRLVRVLYDERLQRDRARGMLSRAIQCIGEEGCTDAGIPVFASVAAARIAAFLPTLKSRAFEVEDEWRIVISKADREGAELKFDTSRGAIRPFLAFPLADAGAALPVLSVHALAPARPDIAVKAASLVLRSASLPDVPVLYSDVPFAE